MRIVYEQHSSSWSRWATICCVLFNFLGSRGLAVAWSPWLSSSSVFPRARATGDPRLPGLFCSYDLAVAATSSNWLVSKSGQSAMVAAARGLRAPHVHCAWKVQAGPGRSRRAPLSGGPWVSGLQPGRLGPPPMAALKQPETGAHDSGASLAKQQSAEEARRTKETNPPARDPREPEGPYRPSLGT
jgi:hypothetical protein